MRTETLPNALWGPPSACTSCAGGTWASPRMCSTASAPRSTAWRKPLLPICWFCCAIWWCALIVCVRRCAFLLTMACVFVQMGQQSEPVIMMQTLILKVFRCCVEEEVPPLLQRDPTLVNPWLELTVAILLKEIPTAVQPTDPVLRPRFCWWLLKKVAAKALYRFVRGGEMRGGARGLLTAFRQSRKMIASDVAIPPEEPSDDVRAWEDDAIDPPTWRAYRERMRLKKAFAKHVETHVLGPVFIAELRYFATLPTGEGASLVHSAFRLTAVQEHTLPRACCSTCSTSPILPFGSPPCGKFSSLRPTAFSAAFCFGWRTWTPSTAPCFTRSPWTLCT